MFVDVSRLDIIPASAARILYLLVYLRCNAIFSTDCTNYLPRQRKLTTGLYFTVLADSYGRLLGNSPMFLPPRLQCTGVVLVIEI